MKKITVDCPDQLAAELDAFVNAGWARSQDQVVIDGLRRYLFSHRPELQEAQVISDVQWGLEQDEA